MSKSNYDLTPVMCEIFDKMVDNFVLALDEKGDFINDPQQLVWESKEFQRHSIEKIYRAMYARQPYDANSKTALSTDVSPAKIRYIVNKK